jgi:hypothetical protein
MNTPKIRIAAAVAGVLLPSALALTGCASVPKEETSQANQTALLVQNFQAEAQEFKRVQALIASQRIASIKRMQTKVSKFASDAKFDDRAARLAGQDARSKLITDLQALGESRTKDAQDLAKALADLDTNFASLLSPLPDISPALDRARKTLAVLGDDLSTEDRIKAMAKFAKDVKDAVDNNKKLIEEAKAGAAAAASAAAP